MNATGDTEWATIFTGSGDSTSYAVGNEVQTTDDGGYIVVGGKDSDNYRKFGSSDIWLLKTDGDGNVEWSDTFGDQGNDVGVSIQQTKDGGYIVAGEKDITIRNSRGSIWLIKLAAEKTQSSGESGSSAQSSMLGVIWSIVACFAAAGFYKRLK